MTELLQPILRRRQAYSGLWFRLRTVGPMWRALGGLVLAYAVLLAVSAWLGRWTPEYLQGRDLWHFAISRMVVPGVMLGAIAAFMRLVPASLLLAAGLLVIGTISAIKRDATGEPFQVSDMFLAGQSAHLVDYVSWDKWLPLVFLAAALWIGVRAIRFRWWSIPLFLFCGALLASYRVEAVVRFIHDHGPPYGIENLTFSQAESERMNGIATHLYFSTAGLRLKTYSSDVVRAELARLEPVELLPARAPPLPDIYLVLGEAWWRDPADTSSPLDKLVAYGFAEGVAISPVYGGTTPNAEFEVLTAIPVRSFRSGIIPYQHYQQYLSNRSRALPRLLAGLGYSSRAHHNFTARFWLRDQIYPRLGFASFDSMDSMQLEVPGNGWPKDDGLFRHVLQQPVGPSPQFHFIVTVATHGPYRPQRDLEGDKHPGTLDYHERLSESVEALLGFERELRRRGRPYVLLAFGDHLPGLRLHQWKIGMTSESDPRLHLAPILVASNVEDAGALRDQLDGRPFYCLAPLLTHGLRLGLDDLYFRDMAKRCRTASDQSWIPHDAVIQNQLFSASPLN